MKRPFKRVLSLLLSISMAIAAVLPSSSTVSAAGPEPERSDIAGHWAEQPMSRWIGQGLLEGNGEGQYNPDRTATRAEFVALMNRIFRIVQPSADKPFTDVKSDAWYADAVSKIYQAGIIEGVGEGKFKPDAFITREDAAVIVARAFRIDFDRSGTDSGTAAGFADYKQISAYALEAVAALHVGGYMKGRDNRQFAPKAKITRAEIVQLIDNVMGTLINKPGSYSTQAAGNMVVNTDGVTIKELVIPGDLYITQGVGEGELTLDGVTVEGTTYVLGGGKNSIKVRNSTLKGPLIVQKWNAEVRVAASGTTEIPQTVMLSGGILEEEELTDDAEGFDQVEIRLPQGAALKNITLIGLFNKVWNRTPGSIFMFPLNTIIRAIVFDEAAEAAGDGVIEQADLNAAGVKLNKWPKGITFAKGVTASIAGEIVSEDNRVAPSGFGGAIVIPTPEDPGEKAASIVKAGQPNADIIVSPAAGQLEKLAASELQSAIKMVSGAELPVIAGDVTNPVSVVLDQSMLNVIKSGDYPLEIQLINNSRVSKRIHLLQTSGSPISLSMPGEIVLEAGQIQSVEVTVTVSREGVSGVYAAEIQVSVDGRQFKTLDLTVNLNRNLIMNDSLENLSEGAVMPDGWYSPAGVGSSDDREAHTGSRSLRMDLGSNEYTHVRTDHEVWLKEGREYVLTAWVKGTAPGQRMLISIAMPAGGDSLSQKQQQFSISDEWQKIEMTYTPDAAHTTSFNWIHFMIAIGTETMWIDDVSMSEVEQVEPVQRDPDRIGNSSSGEEARAAAAGERKQIILGTPASFPELQTKYANDMADLNNSDGFAIRQEGNRIYIIGSEPKGVLNGVYDFMEKNAEVYWTRSVESGTLYKPQSTITAAKVDYREKSPFAVRGWHLTGYGANGDYHSDLETEKMMARNKLNAKFAETGNLQQWQRYESTGLKAFNLGHNLEFWLPNELYFADHPDYYNVDTNGNYVPVSQQTQLNFYHPDLPGVFAGRINQFLNNQSIEYVGIGINDTHNFNQGELSKQPFVTKDGIVVQPDDPAYKSTIFFNFLNQVAAEVKTAHSNVKIVTFAYFFTDVPPLVEVEDNIVVVMAPATEDERSPFNSSDEQNPNYEYKLKLEKWAEKTKNVVMYNYYGCCYSHSYERPIAEKVQADVRYYRDLGIMGMMPEGIVDNGIQAGTGMQMFEAVAPNWGVNALQFWLIHKLFWNPDADLDALKASFLQKAYGSAAPAMKQYYALIEQGWNYDQQVINWYSSESQLIGKYIIEAGIKDAAQTALDEAWRLADDKAKARIEPIKKTFEVMTYLIGELPDLSANAVKTTASKETILQSLDFSQGPWTSAEPFNDFRVMKTREEVPVETKVYLLWDEENLYVGYENFDDDVSKMIVSDDAPGSWWTSGADDSVETYVTGDIEGDFYAFFSNPKAVHFAYKKGVRPSPETVWETNASTGTDRWNVVQVIPFASIGVDIHTTDTLMGFFFRNYHGMTGFFGWGGGSVWQSSDFNPIHLIEP
ncbi:DUF4838 domain-containing protein [Paenibacillus mendelii]|uniref:DUF4838 domain-containing protein n=1 Tax=Paenibacillus mendelii TaxID=206163 RepID=A0ABV6J360_9BACL|nr:DUF4838 domain-containing protein [Paenibacillus mendelii]MCQ6559423.1 DUF4838 domain-containing protein [Paenibacillus mendelii]